MIIEIKHMKYVEHSKTTIYTLGIIIAAIIIRIQPDQFTLALPNCKIELYMKNATQNSRSVALLSFITKLHC